jgi:hypothetical protein
LELDHLELDERDSLHQVITKMCLATNKKKEFTEQYRVVGANLNSAQVALIRAKTPEEKIEAKAAVQIQKGLYKELETIIDLYKDTINCLKMQQRAEHV